GSRTAASNSIEDISKLIAFAHKFNAKIYITLNTLLFDEELEDAHKMIWQLYNSGADAFIIQDMGILKMDIPPLPLIASTQTHNTSPEKIKFLEDVGFKRAILARELSIDEIKKIRSQTNIELETFVHGALCVSYSGQCYLSYALGGRSGNRGACAQPCRLPMDIYDSDGKLIQKNKHILSLKDLNLSEHLNELLQAGVTSFKIEGRLKDINYIKNIVSFYRQKIDAILEDKYTPSSTGKVSHFFIPDSEKTFNRDYTSYFLHGRNSDISSFETPKSKGKYMGKISDTEKKYFKLDSNAKFHSGDGICFFDKNKTLHGTYISKIDGEKIFPDTMLHLAIGTEIFRNSDIEFERILKTETASRKILVQLFLKESEDGFQLEAKDESDNTASIIYSVKLTEAENLIKSTDALYKQLSKSGNTIFEIQKVFIPENWTKFIPISTINNARRKILEKLETEIDKSYIREEKIIIPNSIPYPEKELFFNANISNKMAEQFYRRHGCNINEYALETTKKVKDKTVMTAKHCPRFSLKMCPRYHNADSSSSFYLKINEINLSIEFDCKNCEIKINY
ncbi:MAG: hypothetical protein A2491_03140, partial [Bacteroidetes bacterium RIFOXYC12_FULL_35_7]